MLLRKAELHFVATAFFVAFSHVSGAKVGVCFELYKRRFVGFVRTVPLLEGIRHPLPVQFGR